MPILSEEGRRWISSRTGEQVSLDSFRATTTHQSWFSTPVSHGASPHSSPEELFRLPDPSIVHQALEMFRFSPCRVVFPLVDPVLFPKIITLAYEPPDGPFSLECITAKCCVFAFLSIAYIFWNRTVQMPRMDGDAFAMKAYQLLPDVVEDTSIVGLQAISMLVSLTEFGHDSPLSLDFFKYIAKSVFQHLHQTVTGRLQSAAMLHAVVCRAMFTLGGHVYVPIKPYSADISDEERESRQLRLLFWLCYTFDKDIALRLNQPPLLSDDYCDLTLPEGYVNSYLFPSSVEKLSFTDRLGADENFVPLFPGELFLSRLKGEAARLLYSAQAARKTEAELFHDIRTLDDEVEKWRQSLAPEFRPSLSISPSSVPNICSLTPTSMRYIFMHLEYHHIMTTIHRASGRCASPSTEGGPKIRGPNGGVQSSIDLTLEAGRSTLIFLKTTIRGLVEHAFWWVFLKDDKFPSTDVFRAAVFYPTAAIMCLFLNVLESPMAPQAESDLELLSSAAETIRSIPAARMTSREISHMQSMDRLVAELVRLGNSAIALERRRQNSGNHERHCKFN